MTAVVDIGNFKVRCARKGVNNEGCLGTFLGNSRITHIHV